MPTVSPTPHKKREGEGGGRRQVKEKWVGVGMASESQQSRVTFKSSSGNRQISNVLEETTKVTLKAFSIF